MIAFTSHRPDRARTDRALLSLALLLGCFGGAQSIVAAETRQTFAAFNARVDIDIEDGEVEVWATFTPGRNLDLSTEAVSLHVNGGTAVYSVTIAAGSFKKEGSGGFKFQGTINKVKLEAWIKPARDGVFDFELQTERANLRGVANPLTVTLAIGNTVGSATVRAKIE